MIEDFAGWQLQASWMSFCQLEIERQTYWDVVGIRCCQLDLDKTCWDILETEKWMFDVSSTVPSYTFIVWETTLRRESWFKSPFSSGSYATWISFLFSGVENNRCPVKREATPALRRKRLQIWITFMGGAGAVILGSFSVEQCSKDQGSCNKNNTF